MVSVATGDGAAEAHDPAPDRRGDDQPAAHGGEDRAGVHRAGRARPRRLARGGRRIEPAERHRTGRRSAASNRDDQARLREQHAKRAEKPLLTLAQARRNRLAIDWAAEDLPTPSFLGPRTIDGLDLQLLVPFIDWTFFFNAWQLKGRVPAIFDHPQYGSAARELYDNAQTLLSRIVREGRLTASGVYGFWPAASDGDDIVLFRDEARSGELLRFNMLRQQEVIADDKPNRCLADFVAPLESGRRDYVGAFAVTAGLGIEALVAEFERDHDDYHAIMVKALADRLAEAFAEYLHAEARRDWGYGADERLSPEDLAAEKYRGIRPAFGYPACPDHTEKLKLFHLLGARERRAVADRELRDAAGRQRQRPLPREPARPLLRRRAPRRRPGRGLRAAEGDPAEEAERWLAP